jgi:hypothetical protein
MSPLPRSKCVRQVFAGSLRVLEKEFGMANGGHRTDLFASRFVNHSMTVADMQDEALEVGLKLCQIWIVTDVSHRDQNKIGQDATALLYHHLIQPTWIAKAMASRY